MRRFVKPESTLLFTPAAVAVTKKFFPGRSSIQVCPASSCSRKMSVRMKLVQLLPVLPSINARVAVFVRRPGSPKRRRRLFSWRLLPHRRPGCRPNLDVVPSSPDFYPRIRLFQLSNLSRVTEPRLRFFGVSDNGLELL